MGAPPGGTGSSADGPAAEPHGRRRAAALGALLASCALFALLGEGVARAYWMLRADIPFSHPELAPLAIYPELRAALSDPPARGNATFDILFLGGSVLDDEWGQVGVALQEKLASAGHRGVRIFNMARPAHTSRDSRIKYVAMAGARFDLVLFYHGVNDARVNNAPPEIFREDYSHLAWYENANALTSRGRNRFALPVTLAYLGARLRQTLAPERYAPLSRPREEWVRFGSDLRSAHTFAANLRAIARTARRRGDPLVIATFALHVPEDYSLDRFRRRQLDYRLFHSPLELWGSRANVVAAVAAHNAVARRIASAHPEIALVDQARLMPRGARYFNDPCHLTIEGSARFVENLLAADVPALERLR